jgi:hypothetical protein
MDKTDEFYKFDESIAYALADLGQFVEGLFQPVKQSAATLQALARVLLVLRRMPKTTPGVNGAVSIGLERNDELRYCQIEISDDEFGLSDGGSDYDPRIGSDSYSSVNFYMQPGGYIKGCDVDIYDWINGASELLRFGAQVSEDSINDDDGIDWEEYTEEEES